MIETSSHRRRAWPAPGRTPGRAAGVDHIGRAPDNDIVIPDVLASEYHATYADASRAC